MKGGTSAASEGRQRDYSMLYERVGSGSEPGVTAYNMSQGGGWDATLFSPA